MKVLLRQITATGTLAIATGSDGAFHVVWKGAAVGSASTLRSALELACGRSWAAGTRVEVSTLPEDWMIGA
ncbi:hypothetical protein [Piscinibacter koreensis]|uniref:Uncharacterized protein n=1 Tax=Piscinibacter koreensis TaxID=2742824 RepID=A0A7Y6NNK2_9BURK|nr:hypothetical protein [Schlegelella koreensis]NUZ06488.1 hypothetical protein [Schlegelella koreensis]